MTKLDIKDVMKGTEAINFIALLRRNVCPTNHNRGKKDLLIYDINDVYQFVRAKLMDAGLSDEVYDTYDAGMDAINEMKRKGIT